MAQGEVRRPKRVPGPRPRKDWLWEEAEGRETLREEVWARGGGRDTAQYPGNSSSVTRLTLGEF